MSRNSLKPYSIHHIIIPPPLPHFQKKLCMPSHIPGFDPLLYVRTVGGQKPDDVESLEMITVEICHCIT